MLPNIPELLSKSVTQQDHEGQYRVGHPSGGVWHFFVGGLEGGLAVGALPPELPPYWTQDRDRLLRYTVIRGGLWADAVSIAATKEASRSWEVEADKSPQLIKRIQQIMLALDGTSWTKGIQRGVRDFLTTDNGEFWEIVRSSGAAGSRILGLLHLDSLRCIRTGDDEVPLIYQDIKGRWHELRQHEVIMLCDQPSASAELFGVGLCAASRAYQQIFKMDSLATYFNEKITGSKVNEIHFVNNVSEKTLATAIASVEAENVQRGMKVYKGVAVVPVYSENAITGYSVSVKGVPDGFDHKIERDIAILEFANAIGLDLQDLQPLSGQGLGTGAQSLVQMEKAKGKGLSARRKDFVHEINMKVVPDRVTFSFAEIDLSDEHKKAEIEKIRQETRGSMVQSQEITPEEARALAVESGDLPEEFRPILQNELDDSVADDQKAQTPEERQEQQQEQLLSQSQETTPDRIQSEADAKEHKRIDAILRLASAIDNVRRK